METLEKVQTKQKAILMAINQVQAILGPVRTGLQKSNEFQVAGIPENNIERLALQSDFISNDFVKISVINKPDNLHGWHPCHRPDEQIIKIEGENFGYAFAPYTICEIKKQVEKSFKAVGSFTKKANTKHLPKVKQLAQPFKIAKIEPIKALDLSITDNKMLKNNNKTMTEDSKKSYICNSINDELKTVNFQLEGKYIEQIHAGAKIEDYRAINPVNAKKLCDHIKKEELGPDDHYVTHFKEIWRVKTDLTHVRFFNGYKTDRKELLCELKKIEVNTFRKYIPEGMKPGTSCFTLFLGQIVVSKNFKS